MVVGNMHSQSISTFAELGRKEWVENMFYDVFRHAASIIRKRFQLHYFSLIQASKIICPCSRPSEGVHHRIINEVNDDLGTKDPDSYPS